jgi:3-hydroxyacyl-CoA dehydrogenase/enoyl-CoA hydratase/3-hydroxybutyryl-CoA epimerase
MTADPGDRPEAGQGTLPLEGPGVYLETRRDGLAFLIFDRPQERVNVLNAPVVAVLEILIEQLSRDDKVRALIVMSAKPGSFIAGADVNEIRALKSIQDAEAASRKGQRLFDALDRLPFPVLAAINGTCLGGGTELALACHLRLAADDPRVEIGLPEVRLGILPGWGGTQRLPRMVGLRAGLDLILTGRSVDARRALKMGLVDEVAPPEYLLEAAERMAIAAADGRRRPRRLLSDGPLQRVNPVRRAAVAAVSFLARRGLRGRVRPDHYPAPYRAVEAVAYGLTRGFGPGLENEARLLGSLAASATCKNLVGVFFLQQAARKDSGIEGDVARPRDIRTAAVIGAGAMGGGIAQALARAGVRVRLKDIDAGALARGLRAARDVFAGDLRRRRLGRREFDQKMALIQPTLDATGLRRCDLVIEAVFESLEVKHKVLDEAQTAIPGPFLFASNTSSLSIGAIGRNARDRSSVVGMHFFNPVHKMPLVEVVRGPETSDEAVATVVALARRMGKTPIVVGDAPGFLVNRILMAYLGEALVMVEEGARIEDIDRTMIEFGFPMGPLHVLDQVGLDVAGHVANVLAEAFRDRAPRSTAAQILKDKGWLGRKSGRGFYVYTGAPAGAPAGGAASAADRGGGPSEGGTRRRGGAGLPGPRDVNHAVYALISNKPRQIIDPGPTEARLVLPMINEAARCLEAGVVRTPGHVDLGMILGTGFPPFRGGLLRYADTLGPTTVVQGLEALASRHGTRFVATRLLLEMARAGRKFYDS